MLCARPVPFPQFGWMARLACQAGNIIDYYAVSPPHATSHNLLPGAPRSSRCGGDLAAQKPFDPFGVGKREGEVFFSGG